MADGTQILFETPFWKVILMDEQRYLGRSAVVLKRPCGDLADLTPEEFLDFREVVRTYEQALRGLFGATMFNWACLMNNAYQTPDPKPQVHWHVRPRYATAPIIGSERFEDPNFGHHYLRGNEANDRLLDSTVLADIAARIRSHLQ